MTGWLAEIQMQSLTKEFDMAAASTSIGDTLNPPTLMTSEARPERWSIPSSSMVPTSEVKTVSSRRTVAVSSVSPA